MTHTPFGLRDYLPQDIKTRDALIDTMASAVVKSGFDRIITPSIEHFDQIKEGLGAMADHSILFFDSSGSRLVLRPDHTAPIARIVSTRLMDQLPLRLYYHDPVFRKDPLLGETEIFQFGCEYIGLNTLADEMDMIELVLEICHAVGLNDVEIHVGHTESLKNLPDVSHSHMQLGDWTSLGSLPSVGSDVDYAQFSYLSDCNAEIQARGLKNVVVNAGLYKDLKYYDGLYFDVVSPSFGKVIASGGRYDSVFRSFNTNVNAFGFAFRFHYLERAIECYQSR